MLRLAQRICSDFHHFGIFLGLELYTIEAITADNNKVVDRAFEIVKTWRYACKKPGLVTEYYKLRDALSGIGRNDLVEFVRLGE